MPERTIRVVLSTVSDVFRSYRNQFRGEFTRHNAEMKIQKDSKHLGGVTGEKLEELQDEFERLTGEARMIEVQTGGNVAGLLEVV
jgi:hypothetical protein